MTILIDYKTTSVRRICADSITESLFHGDDKAIVFDVDGVLVRQIARYFNGTRAKDSYFVDVNAMRVLKKAEQSANHVVLWSAVSNYLNFFGQGLFKQVRYHVFGFNMTRIRKRPYKDLRRIHEDLSKVVGIEDDGMFYPRERVVRVYPKTNLIYTLEEALDKL